MKKVLFIGDINIDIILNGLKTQISIDHEVPCQSFDITVGSPAVISACVYSILGGKAYFIGLAGKDYYGNFMINEMKRFGVNTDLVQKTDIVNTGVTINLIHQNTRTQVTYPGTISEFQGSNLDKTILLNFDHLHFAGVYQQTKFRPKISNILKIANDHSITTSLDPQWDSLENWQEMDEWLPMLTFLFVNEAEVISITKASSIEEACKIIKCRTSFPIIKAGEKGAFIDINGIITNIPTRRNKIVDTTGAGDNFNSGFLYAYLEKKMTPFETCRFANAVGSRSCMFIGGVMAQSTYKDIIDFMEDGK